MQAGHGLPSARAGRDPAPRVLSRERPLHSPCRDRIHPSRSSNRAKTGIIGWGLVVGWWLVVGKKRGGKGGGKGEKGGGREGKREKKAGVILPCQNGYYDSNIKVLLIVVQEITILRYH